MLLTSLPVIRRRFFEFFRLSHYAFIGVAVVTALHTSVAVPYLIAAAVLLALDYATRIVWGLWPRRASVAVLNSSHGVPAVRIRFPKHSLARCSGSHKPGQFVSCLLLSPAVSQQILLNVPAVSPFQWHPFSLVSSPLSNSDEVCVRASGDFCKQLIARCESRSSLWVRAEGPYGGIELDFVRFPSTIFVAGGIGITPCIGMLNSIFRLDDALSHGMAATSGSVYDLHNDTSRVSGRPTITVVWIAGFKVVP